MSVVDDVVGQVKSSLLAIGAGIEKLRGFNLSAIVALIADVVLRVERIVPEYGRLSSSEKKEAATKVLNELIDIPALPEWLEEKVFGLVIDALVMAMNKWFGKSWGTLPAAY